MKKLVLIGLFILSPIAVSAQSDSVAIIQQLQEQVKALQAQVEGLKVQITQVRNELNLTRALSRGLSGDDVKELQTFLKETYPELYTAPITGYFGPITETAIKKLQEKQGIEVVGIVGPKTAARINELISQGAGKSGVVPPGLLTAPGFNQQIIQPVSTNSTTQQNSGTTSSSEGGSTQTYTYPTPAVTYTYPTPAATSTYAYPTPYPTPSPTPGDSTPPTAPSNLNVTLHPNTAPLMGWFELSWTGSVDTESPYGSYTAYIDNAEWVNFAGRTLNGGAESTTRSMGDPGMPYGRTYTFYVVAHDGAGNVSAQSNTVTATFTSLSTGTTTSVYQSSNIATVMTRLQNILRQLSDLLGSGRGQQ